MNVLRMMFVCVVTLLCSSTVFAQAPAPIDDDGIGQPDVCLVCNGIMASITAQQAAYAAMEADVLARIEGYEAEIAQFEADLQVIQASPNLTPEQKAIALLQTREAIAILQQLIDAAEADLA